MMNHISLMGRLVADPELRSTNSGKSVASMTVACDRDYAPQGAERETDFIDLTAWGSTAEFAAKWMHKGQLIGVDGRLESKKWQDKHGQNRVSYYVNVQALHFAERREQGQTQAAPAAYRSADVAYTPTAGRMYADPAAPLFDAMDDDTPF